MAPTLVKPWSWCHPLGGLARYSVHTTATWNELLNITQKVRNNPDGIFLVSPLLIESRSYKKSSL